MTPQVELLELIRKEISDSCKMPLRLDGMPAKGGISAELAPGYTDSLYYDKSAIRIIPVLFMSKGKDQRTVVNDLCQVCNCLQRLKTYPQTDGFVWLDVETATEPNLVGRQEDGQYMYSAVMNAKIYF